MSIWRVVDDLPPHNTIVLAFSKANGEMALAFRRRGKGIFFYEYPGEPAKFEGVTHWMRLPEFPS